MAIQGGGYPAVPGRGPGDAQARGWGAAWPTNCVGQGALQKTITLNNGVRLTVHEQVAELVRLLLNYCLLRNYVIRQRDTGGYDCRAIRNSDPPRASNHSWGLAIDVNWTTNVQYGTKTDIPPWMVSVLYAHGFYWGGWYSSGSEDPMHFEFIGRPSDVERYTIEARKLAMALTAADAKVIWDYAISSNSLGIGQGAGDWLKAGERAVRAADGLREDVEELRELITAPAPVEVDYTRLAEALRPIVVEVLTSVRVSVEPPTP